MILHSRIKLTYTPRAKATFAADVLKAQSRYFNLVVELIGERVDLTLRTINLISYHSSDIHAGRREHIISYMDQQQAKIAVSRSGEDVTVALLLCDELAQLTMPKEDNQDG